MVKHLLEASSSEKGVEPVLVVSTQRQVESDLIMKFLDANTSTAAIKTFKSLPEIMREFGIASSLEPNLSIRFVHLMEALSKRWEDRQVVMLLDDILDVEMVNNLSKHQIPENIRLVMNLNPITSLRRNLSLPPSFLHIKNVPYRSTIAITSLARFMATCQLQCFNF